MTDGDEKNAGYSVDEYAGLTGFDSEWRDNWWNQDFLELMARRWRLDEVRSALDVGCGYGHWGQRLSTVLPGDAKLAGVDHEAGFLDNARERASSLGLSDRCEYREGTADALPFEDDTFDLVTCQTVLIHVADARASLREMMRVARPGGLVVAAEPNNLVNSLVERMSEPGPELEELLRLLRFAETCNRGKLALNQGDNSVGERLPGYFAELGLEDLRVHTNDRCATLIPPYAPRDQRADLAMQRMWNDEDVADWGDKPRSRHFFTAGGGDDSDFDDLWSLHRRIAGAFLACVDRGALHAGRGYLQYLVSGRKPA